MTLRSFLVKRLVYTVVLIFFVIVLNWIIFLAIPGLQSGYGSLIASYSMPTFFLGIVLIMIFAIGLHWLPAGGTFPQAWFSAKPDVWTQIVVRLQYLILPALTLTLVSFGGFLLLTRATMMEVLSED